MYSTLENQLDIFLREKDKWSHAKRATYLKELLQLAIVHRDCSFILNTLLPEISFFLFNSPPKSFEHDFTPLFELYESEQPENIPVVYLIHGHMEFMNANYVEARKIYNIALSISFEYKQYHRVSIALNNLISLQNFYTSPQLRHAHGQTLKVVVALLLMETKMNHVRVAELLIAYINHLIGDKQFDEALLLIHSIKAKFTFDSHIRLNYQLRLVEGSCYINNELHVEKGYQLLHELLLECFHKKIHFDIIDYCYEEITKCYLLKHPVHKRLSEHTIASLFSIAQAPTVLQHYENIHSNNELARFEQQVTAYMSAAGHNYTFVHIDFIIDYRQTQKEHSINTFVYNELHKTFGKDLFRILQVNQACIQCIIGKTEQEVDALLFPLIQYVRTQFPVETTAVQLIVAAAVGNHNYEVKNYVDATNIAKVMIYSELYK